MRERMGRGKATSGFQTDISIFTEDSPEVSLIDHLIMGQMWQGLQRGGQRLLGI